MMMMMMMIEPSLHTIFTKPKKPRVSLFAHFRMSTQARAALPFIPLLFPSLSLPSSTYFLPFPSRPFDADPRKPARGLGSAVSSPSGVKKPIWCTLDVSKSHWWQLF